MNDETPQACDLELGEFFQNRFGEYYLYPVSGNAFERTGSETVFLDYFGAQLGREDTLFVILGSDSGLLLNYLLECERPKKSRYILVEPVELIDRINERPRRPPEDPEQVFLTSLETWRTCIPEEVRLQYLHRNRVVLMKSVGAADGHFFLYAPLWRELKTQVDDEIWNALVQHGFSLHLLTQVFNIPDNAYPAIRLEGTLRGYPAVVMGAGPSLVECIPWIQQHRHNLVLIAVSRVARVLKLHGLVPDIFVSLDPNHHSLMVSHDMLDYGEKTLFINGYHTQFDLVQGWAGPKAYVGPLYPWQTRNAVANWMQAGPTVSNLALDIAIRLGCNPVYLAGVDLCFSPTGMSHTQGTLEASAGPTLMLGERLVKTNDDRITETKNEFLQAAQTIESMVSLARLQGYEVFNLAPQALAMEGVMYRPTDELSVPEKPQSAWEHLQGHLPKDWSAMEQRHLNTAIKELLTARKNFASLLKMARQALAIKRRMFDDKCRMVKGHLKPRLDQIERQIDRELGTYANFAKRLSIQRLIRDVRASGDLEWTDQEIHDYVGNYYGTYAKVAEELTGFLDETITKARSRLLELDKGKVSRKLFEQWDQGKNVTVLGHGLNSLRIRATRWKRVHSDRYEALDEQDRAYLDELVEKCDIRRKEYDPSLPKTLVASTSLNGLIGRIEEYFMSAQREALERLIRGLEHHASPADATPYLHFVKGLVALLDGDEDAAAADFIQVKSGPAREPAQKRLLTRYLDLGDLDKAYGVLKELASMSPFYAPFLADLLRIMGRVSDALDYYTAYLKASPFDISAMMKMAMLYDEIGAHQSAYLTCDLILNLYPGHSGALAMMAQLEASGVLDPPIDPPGVKDA
ncbi:putative 6-hydroxymethylpterin diphosphokinase MptE-like domain-containing protein [Gammaproteobacteria bacterium]